MNQSIKVLVTGANGQLGKCIQDVALRFPKLTLILAGHAELDITNEEAVSSFFKANDFEYCINAAAYTNVEKAESEPERAHLVNARAVQYLAKACDKHHVTIFHISTDYVFDGKKKAPYTEEDETNPINSYGDTKLLGEKALVENASRYFILRTSWVYSQYGHNFLKTILNYARERKSLTITTEQTGTPTNANDLAFALLHIISTGNTAYGTYHFANKGQGTWYDFAKTILEYSGQLEATSLAHTAHYRTFAVRPKYSVLDTSRFQNNFSIVLIDWKESLRSIISKTNN